MDITPAPTKEQHLIQSYGAGRFVVREQEISENILVWPTGVELMGQSSFLSRQESMVESSPGGEMDPGLRRDDDKKSWDDGLSRISLLISPLPELLIVGTGQWMLPLPVDFKESLKKQGIKCEPMDTGAACRTYNVLVSEDRRVAAYLMAV